MKSFAIATAFAVASAAQADVITFPDFSNTSGLTLNGDAAVVNSGGSDVLRLAKANGFSGGSVFSDVVVNARDFYTKFSFRISNPGGIDDGDGVGADGLAFVVQSVSNSIGGLGGGLGYEGIASSVAVGFDTYDNGTGAGDNDGNHVEIDSNGSVFSLAQTPITPRMNDGDVFYSWIAYDGTTLNVWLNSQDFIPGSPILSLDIDIAGIIGQDQGYVGFTSATGSAFGDHDILSWEYSPNIPAPISAAPLAALALFRRRR
jgi:hypothetical protein